MTVDKRERQSGYVLFGVVIALVILGISMTAAVPLWQKVMQREKEQELIFRGYQYMQAIDLYQKKYPGAFPPDVETLVKEKFLRKAYADPMTEKGEFRLLRQMSPELQPGAQAGGERAAERAGITGLNRSQARMRPQGQPGTGGTSRQPTGGQFQSAIGRQASEASMGGIVGVVSTYDEETFYKVPGKEKYKDWLFVFGLQQGPGGQPGAVVPPSGGPRGLSAPGGQQRPLGQPASSEQPQQPQPGRSSFNQPGGSSFNQPGRGGQTRGALGAGGAPNNRSPFPGLPPPPGFTQFRFGSSGTAGGPATVPPGQAPGVGGQGAPQQRPGGFGGQGQGFGNPGQGGFQNPGQGGFGNPGQGGFGNPGQRQGFGQQQPRQQQQRQQ